MYGRSGENAGGADGNSDSVDAGFRTSSQVPAVINRPSVFAKNTSEGANNNNNNNNYYCPEPDQIEQQYPIQQVN
jgi:hypothetical protein